LKDSGGEAQTLLNLGYSYSDLSETEKAAACYREALRLWHARGNPVGEANTLAVLGHLESKQGEKQQALDHYQNANILLKNIGDWVLEGSIFNGMGFVYEELSEPEKALTCYEQALSFFQKGGSEDGQAGALMKLGEVYQELLQSQKAITNFQQALEMFRVLGNPRMQSFALRNLGRAYASLNNTTLAIDYYKQALSLNRSHEDRRGQAYILNDLGQACEVSGERLLALHHYNKALVLNRATGDRFGEAATLCNVARLQRDLGKFEEARVPTEQALRIVESLRTKVFSQDLRTSYSGSVHQQYELHVDILMQLQKQHPIQRFDIAALEASECARTRSFIETLAAARADIREGVDQALLERERALQTQLNTKAEEQVMLLSGNHQKLEADVLEQEIQKLTSEYQEVEGRIRANSPRYAALTQPQPLSLAEIQQQVLNDDTLLLEYMLGDERSYVWAVTRTEVSSFELPGRAQIENAARRFYKLLTANQPVPGETFEQRQARVAEANAHISEEAAAFSKLVLGPVMTKLGTKRLLIVPDGALQYIPFQALVVPGKANASAATPQSQLGAGSDEQIPLIFDHEIVNEPSASALALVMSETAQRKPAPKTVAVLANPVFEADDPRVKSRNSSETQVAKLSQETEVKEAFRDVGLGEGLRIPPLPASRDEANAIMAMAPWGTGFKAEGFEASRATITRPELGQYRIVHFATHGFVDYEHPELSGLVLSLVDEKGNPQDGFLRMHDIYNLKLPADLVVLSACNTGLGKEVKGEGLIGLTRGFMYAGAAGVAASLWKVDDEATAELMKRFYEGMFQKGLTPAAALREAQLGMWRQKRWHAPYYWAAFVIQGQYNQKENMSLGPTQTVKSVAALGSLAAAASLAVFLLLRRRRRTIL
jgi:CHAT domain-containing protein